MYFDTALFLQCIATVISVLFLLFFCFKYSYNYNIRLGDSILTIGLKDNGFRDLLLSYFGAQALAIVLISFFDEKSKQVQLFGIISAIIESVMALPQLYHNYKRSSVKGFR